MILHSNSQYPDDEFLAWAKLMVSSAPFEVVSAQNLEGIQERVYTHVNQNPDSSGCGALISERIFPKNYAVPVHFTKEEIAEYRGKFKLPENADAFPGAETTDDSVTRNVCKSGDSRSAFEDLLL